ncbi:MAG: LuxR family transcriptional regulator [Rhodospirillales bacterium]|jgi:DNA-binding CsgD family transcriptional regulator|nr:LuxR family transcriptional regulator [Rhodospirillales bacterium]
MTLALANGPQVFPDELTQFLAFEALDVLAVGIIFANANSAILHANRAARDIAAQDDGFKICDGRLGSSSVRHDKSLRALIAQAARGSGQMARLCLPRKSHLRPYLVLVSPLGDPTRFALSPASPDRPVLVFVRDPESGFELSSGDVSAFLGLTPAEARVLIAIADGASLADVSRSLSLSRNTVRSHLQHIFAKTGVSRQSELVLLASKMSFGRNGCQAVRQA